MLPLLPRQIGKRENSRYAAQNTPFIQVSAFLAGGQASASPSDPRGRRRWPCPAPAQLGDLILELGLSRLAPLEPRVDVRQAGAQLVTLVLQGRGPLIIWQFLPTAATCFLAVASSPLTLARSAPMRAFSCSARCRLSRISLSRASASARALSAAAMCCSPASICSRRRAVSALVCSAPPSSSRSGSAARAASGALLPLSDRPTSVSGSGCYSAGRSASAPPPPPTPRPSPVPGPWPVRPSWLARPHAPRPPASPFPARPVRPAPPRARPAALDSPAAARRVPAAAVWSRRPPRRPWTAPRGAPVRRSAPGAVR